MSEKIPSLGKLESTDKGFPVIDFTDSHGTECSVEMSTLAHNEQPGTSALWIGPDKKRMHLERNQVIQLMYVLDSWLRTGEFLNS